MPLLLPGDWHQGEFWGQTHPARASVVRAPGGLTLGPGQRELGADFTALGIDCRRFGRKQVLGELLLRIWSRISGYLFLDSTPVLPQDAYNVDKFGRHPITQMPSGHEGLPEHSMAVSCHSTAQICSSR